MGELYNPYPKLPRNIRQIGERDQSIRLYMEDYVNTYLKRLFPKGGQDLRVGVLLGTSEEHEGIPYLFVDGAMEIEDVTEAGEKVEFSEIAWKKTYQTIEQMFPKRVIMGWFLCGGPGSTLSPLNYWKQHSQYFAGKNQLMYLNCSLDGEEAAYVASENGFYRLRGYSIYYERNQMMQDYMILRKDVRRVESGTGDPVIRDFRQRMEENKNQVTARRSAMRVLSGLCMALTVVLLAGGVTMIGNYRRMREMEAVIASVLPVEDRETEPADDQQETMVVLEAPGGLQMEKETAGQEDHTPQKAVEETEAVPEESSYEDDPEQDVDDEASHQVLAGQTVHQVQEGETLYGICLEIYGNGNLLDEICQINGLEDENKIIAGQNLILP